MTDKHGTVLFVRNVIASPFCVSAADGRHLGVTLREHLRLGYDPHLSFAETATLSTHFVAAFLDGLNPETFHVSGLSPENQRTYDQVAANPARHLLPQPTSEDKPF